LQGFLLFPGLFSFPNHPRTELLLREQFDPSEAGIHVPRFSAEARNVLTILINAVNAGRNLKGVPPTQFENLGAVAFEQSTVRSCRSTTPPRSCHLRVHFDDRSARFSVGDRARCEIKHNFPFRSRVSFPYGHIVHALRAGLPSGPSNLSFTTLSTYPMSATESTFMTWIVRSWIASRALACFQNSSIARRPPYTSASWARILASLA
jgi:hypothetical protein